MEPQKILNNQSNLEKEENARDIIHPDFKLYYRAIVIKQYNIGMKRDKDRWNGIDRNRCTCLWVYDKKAENIQWRKNSLFDK